MHHSEEKYLKLLDSFNGLTETYHLTSLTVSPGVTEPNPLTLMDSFTWRYWTVTPDVTGQFHMGLLNRITWCNWTVPPGVTGSCHLTLLDSFTCHSEPVGQFHLALLKPFTWPCSRAVQYATPNSLICDCSWNDRNQHDKFLNDIEISDQMIDI